MDHLRITFLNLVDTMLIFPMRPKSITIYTSLSNTKKCFWKRYLQHILSTFSPFNTNYGGSHDNSIAYFLVPTGISHRIYHRWFLFRLFLARRRKPSNESWSLLNNASVVVVPRRAYHGFHCLRRWRWFLRIQCIPDRYSM